MTTQSASLTTSSVNVGPRQRTIHEQQRVWGWIFLSPWIIGFLAFTLLPMIASLVFSFTDFTIGKDVHFIGLENWQNLFKDPVTLQSLSVTVRFGVLMLPISLLFPLMLASLLNSKWLVAR